MEEEELRTIALLNDGGCLVSYDRISKIVEVGMIRKHKEGGNEGQTEKVHG